MTVSVGKFIESVIDVGVEVFVDVKLLIFFNQIRKIFMLIEVDKFFNLLLGQIIIHQRFVVTILRHFRRPPFLLS